MTCGNPQSGLVAGTGSSLNTSSVSANSAVGNSLGQRVLIEKGSPRHIDDDRRPGKQVQALGREQSAGVSRERRRENHHVVRRQLGLELVETDDAFESRR